jgi:ABC-type Zn uptake system ZnuABC Zn-binding protein ZnuA
MRMWLGRRLLVVASALAISGCSSASPPASEGSAGRHLRVVTTVAPITSIVSRIAGDRAVVVGVIPEGTNSHTYEPPPSVAALTSRADLVFVNGLGLEDPVREIAATDHAPGGRIIELGTETITPDAYIYDASFPRDGGKPNPHLWTDPPLARRYAAITAEAMSAADPDGAPVYRANLLAFTRQLDALDVAMQSATATVPAPDRTLLTYHDAYAYFAAHYGYRIAGAIQVSDFQEPTPKEVTALIGQIEAEHVPAIFGSEVFPSPVLEQISEESGARYIDALRDDDLPGRPGDERHSYLELMRFDFVTIVDGLGGDATALQALDLAAPLPDTARYPQ